MKVDVTSVRVAKIMIEIIIRWIEMMSSRTCKKNRLKRCHIIPLNLVRSWMSCINRMVAEPIGVDNTICNSSYRFDSPSVSIVHEYKHSFPVNTSWRPANTSNVRELRENLRHRSLGCVSMQLIYTSLFYNISFFKYLYFSTSGSIIIPYKFY